MRKRFVFAIVALALSAGSLQSQQLTIHAGAGKPTFLTLADIEALPHSKVAAGTSDSQNTYDTVSVKALLEKAGVTFDKSLSGKRLASYLLVAAADGYRVVIALPQLDPAFTDKQILLAFAKNGKPLDDKEGPYRIVIPDEKRMARWVRQVTALDVVDVP